MQARSSSLGRRAASRLARTRPACATTPAPSSVALAVALARGAGLGCWGTQALEGPFRARESARDKILRGCIRTAHSASLFEIHEIDTLPHSYKFKLRYDFANLDGKRVGWFANRKKIPRPPSRPLPVNARKKQPRWRSLRQLRLARRSRDLRPE